MANGESSLGLLGRRARRSARRAVAGLGAAVGRGVRTLEEERRKKQEEIDADPILAKTMESPSVESLRPTGILTPAIEAMKEVMVGRIREFGCNGQASKMMRGA